MACDAKWHTDPADVLHLNRFEKLDVELLRPDGTRAAGETGFSQQASSDRMPKVNFGFPSCPATGASGSPTTPASGSSTSTSTGALTPTSRCRTSRARSRPGAAD